MDVVVYVLDSTLEAWFDCPNAGALSDRMLHDQGYEFRGGQT